MDLKCSHCNEMLPEEKFPVNNSKPKRNFRGYVCLSCQKAYKKTLNYPPCTHPLTCTTCHTEKPAESFAANKRVPNGRASICSVCVRAPSNASKKAREAKGKSFVNRYKRMCGCAQCGYKGHPVALDLDHIDPNTKHSKTKRQSVDYSWSRKRLKEEGVEMKLRLHPISQLPVKRLLVKQSYTCVGLKCARTITKRTARYCYYSGTVFCSVCHKVSRRI